MNIPLETLEVAPLRLPLQERSRLLDRLMASIDAEAPDAAACDAAWEAVADARDDALAEPLDAVLNRLRAGL